MTTSLFEGSNARKHVFKHAFFDTCLHKNGACVLRVRRPLISDLYCRYDMQIHVGLNIQLQLDPANANLVISNSLFFLIQKLFAWICLSVIYYQLFPTIFQISFWFPMRWKWQGSTAEILVWQLCSLHILISQFLLLIEFCLVLYNYKRRRKMMIIWW